MNNILDETIISHEYDVDLIATYHRLSELEFNKKNIIPEERYLELIKEEGESFCRRNALYFPFYFNNKIPLVIPSTTVNFELYVGLHLIPYTIHKIGAFLSYQKNIYEGKDDFVDLVEFRISSIVESNSPIDNSVRLEKIMQWVKQERLLENPKQQKNNQTSSGSASETGEGNNKAKTLRKALLHYYKQQANYLPPFKRTLEKTIKDVMREQGAKYGVSGNNFARLYYDICKKEARVTPKNIIHLEFVVKELSKFPKAKKRAEMDLKAANLMPG